MVSAGLYNLLHRPRGQKCLKHKEIKKSNCYANSCQVADAVTKAAIIRQRNNSLSYATTHNVTPTSEPSKNSF